MVRKIELESILGVLVMGSETVLFCLYPTFWGALSSGLYDLSKCILLFYTHLVVWWINISNIFFQCMQAHTFQLSFSPLSLSQENCTSKLYLLPSCSFVSKGKACKSCFACRKIKHDNLTEPKWLQILITIHTLWVCNGLNIFLNVHYLSLHN